MSPKPHQVKPKREKQEKEKPSVGLVNSTLDFKVLERVDRVSQASAGDALRDRAMLFAGLMRGLAPGIGS